MVLRGLFQQNGLTGRIFWSDLKKCWAKQQMLRSKKNEENFTKPVTHSVRGGISNTVTGEVWLLEE
jgi:hypothetical protein